MLFKPSKNEIKNQILEAQRLQYQTDRGTNFSSELDLTQMEIGIIIVFCPIYRLVELKTIQIRSTLQQQRQCAVALRVF